MTIQLITAVIAVCGALIWWHISGDEWFIVVGRWFWTAYATFCVLRAVSDMPLPPPPT